MTPYEREVIKRIYPLACKGHWKSLLILENLTTRRRSLRNCPVCGCKVKRASSRFCGFQHASMFHKGGQNIKGQIAKSDQTRYNETILQHLGYDQEFYNESILRNLMRG